MTWPEDLDSAGQRPGDRMPWRGTDVGYFEEREILPAADFEDGTLTFS